MKHFFLGAALLTLAACGSFPAFEGSATAQRAPYPQLLPLSAFFGDRKGPATNVNNPSERLEARANRLRARAAILRAPVRDPDDLEAIRARLAR